MEEGLPGPSSSSVQAWTDFLQSYSRGEFSPSQAPPLPPLSPTLNSPYESSSFPFGDDFDRPVYESVEITPSIAGRVRQFVKHNRFLPPPRAPLEDLREQIIKEYDLYSEKQVENIKSATELVQAYFGGLCTFTLFKDNVQELMAVAGDQAVIDAIGLFPGKRLLPETSLCGHCVLSTEADIYVSNLAADWRYTGNPYADELKGIKSYLGSSISLNIDPSSPREERTVAIGVINCMHLDKFLPPLNDAQKKVMGHVKRMLETQLRATWEGQGRTREAIARRMVADFLEDTLVAEESFLPPRAPSDDGLQESKFRSMSQKHYGATANEALEQCAEALVKQVRALVDSTDYVAVLDLRSLFPVKNSETRTIYTFDTEGSTLLPVLAQEGIHTDNSSTEAMTFEKSALAGLLNQYRYERKFIFKSDSVPSSLQNPKHSGPSNILTMPFFIGEQPLFAIFATTQSHRARFNRSDINFTRSLGVILRSKMVQSRVQDADVAKTAFLSSISHELRTPMHGLLSGLQLVREAVDSDDLESARKLLPVMDSSGYALQQILNDVLDFGSLAQGSSDGTRTTKSDVARAVMAVATTCAARRSVTAQGNRVKLLVEIESRNWMAEFDDAGFQRMLFNGLTNAIKVTREGGIIVRLVTNNDNTGIVCTVTDTGPGIEQEFASRLFEAFTKADEFSPGAGLGLYITRKLADRMGGQVQLVSRPSPEQGAILTLSIPVTFETSRVPDAGLEISRFDSGSDAQSEEGHLGHLSDEKQLPALKQSGQRSPADQVSSAEVSLACLPISEISLNDNKTSQSPNDNAKARSKPKKESGSSNINPVRVLVVDDNDIGRKILLSLLRQLGKTEAIATAQATDGLEALDVFRDFRPHLVLTDVSMPRMDGIESATQMRLIEQELKESTKETGSTDDLAGRCKIYAITGLGSSDPRLKLDALKGRAALDGWLIKGQDKLTTIKDIVRDVIRERKAPTP